MADSVVGRFTFFVPTRNGKEVNQVEIIAVMIVGIFLENPTVVNAGLDTAHFFLDVFKGVISNVLSDLIIACIPMKKNHSSADQSDCGSSSNE